MDNGTWALKSNYSNCEPILEEKVSAALSEQSSCHLFSSGVAQQHGRSAHQMCCVDCFMLLEQQYLAVQLNHSDTLF